MVVVVDHHAMFDPAARIPGGPVNQSDSGLTRHPHPFSFVLRIRSTNPKLSCFKQTIKIV